MTPLPSLVASGNKLWLDSIDPDLVRANRAEGATGATRNPIIIHASARDVFRAASMAVCRVSSTDRSTDRNEPQAAIAAPSGRLLFRETHGRDEMVALMTRVLDGTLDAHSRDDLTHMAPAEAAAAHYDQELAEYRSPQEWWRVATLPDGEPVGFVTPARNAYNPIIGYIAVLPEHRGKVVRVEGDAKWATRATWSRRHRSCRR